MANLYSRRTSSLQFFLAAFLALAALAGSTGLSQGGTATSTTLTSDFNPSFFGESVTFTATVTPASTGTPTSTVTFSADSTPLSGVNVVLTGVTASVAGGGLHTCAITSTGGARCWGRNNVGQLGDGTLTDSTAPVDVSGLTSGVRAISAGSDFTCALTSSGGVKCWGRNNLGQLGDTTNTDQNSPVDVSALTSGVVAISAGRTHACALTNTGALKCWGGNNNGQLGDGTTTDQAAPVAVSGMGSGVAAVTAGGNHTCALTTAGGARCWGLNAQGALGDGTTTSRSTAADVSGLTVGVSTISAGFNFSCAVASTGVKCWGDNSSKQLGDGSTTQRTSPVVVSGLTGTPSAIAAGKSHACMLNSAGAIRCWGANGIGQLGNGQTAVTSAPVAVSGFESSGGFIIATGDLHTCAVTSGAALLCWGNNSNGQIGDGSTNAADAPNNVTDFGVGTMVIQYSAKLSVSSLAVGTRSIDAHYDGDGTFDASDAPTLTQTVNAGATTTSITPSPSTANVGQTVTFNVNVVRIAPAVGTPSGTVTVDFGDGGSTVMVSLSGGAGSTMHSYAAQGNYSVSASYGGDASFDISNSGTSVTVNKITSTVALAASPNPAKPGQNVTFTATLTVSSGTPTGLVTFTEGGATLGSAAVSARVAKFRTSTLGIGTHTVRASYGGDTTFSGNFGSTGITIDAKVGMESRVNTKTTDSQQLPAVARLKNGYVIVWASKAQDGSGYGIYGQRYSANDAKVGAEFLVNTVTANNQTQPAVAGLSDGGFAIVWQSTGEDGSGLGVYGQRYSANGAKAGSEFRTNTNTAKDQSAPAIAGLLAGGFVVAWQSLGQDGSAFGIYAQRFDAQGNVKGAEFRVNNTTTNNQSGPSIAALTAGGFVIAWQSAGQDGSGLGVYARRYNAAGAAAGNEFHVNTVTLNDQSLPSAASLSNGGFVVAWQSNLQDGSGLGVFAQRFTPGGVKAGSEFRVNTMTVSDQWQPSVAGFTDGGFVVAWSSKGQDRSGQGVYAQAYNASGTQANIEFRVNSRTASDQYQPKVAAFTVGKFIAVWTSKNQDGALEGVYLQRFTIPVTH